MGTAARRPRLLIAVGLVSSLAAACSSQAESEGIPAPEARRGYLDNIERATLENEDYRRVVYTGRHSQVVLMTLRPGEEIGLEMHPDTDQFIRVEGGRGRVLWNGETRMVEDGSALVLPAGAEHNLMSTGDEPLRMYSIYSPALHAPNTVHRTKREAEAAESGP